MAIPKSFFFQKVLSCAIKLVAESGKLPHESDVQYKIINPKSLTLEQLYGAYDSFSHEWSDGEFFNSFKVIFIASYESITINGA